jgi:hypothetical protein
MAETTDSLCSTIQQRRKQFLFAVPPPRSTILGEDNNPYLSGQHTSFDLNMRRKAEILKYAGNKQSTKQNSFTKKELYKNAMMGSTRASSRVLDCPDAGIIYTRSSAAGVPGPSINLYMDKDVPLYNYETGTEPKGISQQDITDKWTFTTPDENTYFNDDEENQVTSLNITEIIDLPAYTYRMSIPMGLNITGRKLIDGDISYNNLTISLDELSPFEFVVKYNNEYVQNVNSSIDYTYDDSNISSMTFDISNNVNDFNATLYAGVLNITNINLYTESGYTYDFHITPKLKFVIGNADITSNFNVQYDISYGVFMNISETNTSDASGCTITTEPSTQSYVPFTLLNM